jgi:hypothetical protein
MQPWLKDLENKLDSFVKHSESPKENWSEVRKGDRLRILRNFLYGAGISYIFLSIAIITLGALNFTVFSTELTVIIVLIGSAITTIIGVIAGSSID